MYLKKLDKYFLKVDGAEVASPSWAAEGARIRLGAQIRYKFYRLWRKFRFVHQLFRKIVGRKLRIRLPSFNHQVQAVSHSPSRAENLTALLYVNKDAFCVYARGEGMFSPPFEIHSVTKIITVFASSIPFYSFVNISTISFLIQLPRLLPSFVSGNRGFLLLR